MSVIIPRGATFLSVPLVKVRNVLRAWRYGSTEDAHEIAVRKDVALDPRTVMILLDELRDRGLIGPEEQEYGEPVDGLTEKGLALAGADGRKRIPKDKAGQVLQKFLEACSAANRQDLPIYIREIWLFGSMIDPRKSDVGDIDLVMVTEVREGLDGLEAGKQFQILAKEMGATSSGTYGDVFSMFRAEKFVMNRVLHGGQKHPLLSMNSIQELRDMACPCQLVFDASRGGPVSDPVLFRHPDSSGRSNRIGEARSMPDLLEGRMPLRPLPADLTHPSSFHWRTMEAVSLWPEDDARYRLAQQVTSGMWIIPGNEGRRANIKPNVITQRLDLRECDPRHRVGLILCEHTYPDPDKRWESVRVPRFGIILERSIEEAVSGIKYRANIVAGATKGRSVEFEDIVGAEWWLYMLMSADVEHILRREHESGHSRNIAVKVSCRAENPGVDWLFSNLRQHTRTMVNKVRAQVGLSLQEPA